MKVFKLRIWNKVSNVFLPTQPNGVMPTYSVSLSGDIMWGDDNGTYYIRDNQDDYVIQQFTGLLDKNNKEIYEGDILAETHYGSEAMLWKSPISRELVLEGTYPYKGVVQYRSDYSIRYGHAGYVTYPIGSTLGQVIGNAITTPCEVVGNIFENPELLK
jgi:uncharacterized phage protein (TIGR01671 family)